MNIFRKATVFILIIAFAFPYYSFSQSEPEAAGKSIYEKNSEMLTALGIWDFEKKEPEETVSREEFAKAIVDLFGFEEIHEYGSLYSDVKAEDEYAPYIYTLRRLNVMNGTSILLFEGKTAVTYEQAIKVLVSALGYEIQANLKGGYPLGYLYIAQGLKLSAGAASGNKRNLTFGELAELFKKASDTDVVLLSGIDVNSYKFSTEKGKNLLAVYHKIYKGNDILTDNGITALEKESSIAKGYIKFGRSVIRGSSDKVRNMIGCKVDYYYREEPTDNVLLYAALDDRANSSVFIRAEDLQIDSTRFSKTEIIYTDGSRIDTINLSPYANLIYNGASYPAFVADTLKIRSGSLTFVDNGSDNEYDLVIAEEYEDLKVNVVDTVQKRIYDSYNEIIEYGEYGFSEIFNDEGREINYSELKEDTLISVFKSKNLEKIKIIASVKTTEGIIAEFASDERNPSVTLEDRQSFKLSASFLDSIQMDYLNFELPEVGGSYKLYLNYNGYVSFAEKTARKNEYAYFLSAQRAEGVNKDRINIKLVTEKGDRVIVPTAKKIIINKAVNSFNAEEILNIQDLYKDNKFLPQLIKIKFNGQGELTEIETSRNVLNNAYGFDTSRFSMVYKNASSTRYVYPNNFDGRYILNNNTVIFLIPPQDEFDEELIRTIPLSKLPRSYVCSIEMFDADATWNVGACVMSEPDNLDEYIFTIKTVSTVVNEKGEHVYKLTGWWKNNEWTFFEASPGIIKKEVPEGLKFGDIIRFSYDIDFNIDRILLIASPKSNKEPFSKAYAGDIATGTFSSHLGEVYAKSSSAVSLSTDRGETIFSHSIAGDTTYIMVDFGNNTISRAAYADIPSSGYATENGSFNTTDNNTMLFVWRVRCYASECVIYKW